MFTDDWGFSFMASARLQIETTTKHFLQTLKAQQGWPNSRHCKSQFVAKAPLLFRPIPGRLRKRPRNSYKSATCLAETVASSGTWVTERAPSIQLPLPCLPEVLTSQLEKATALIAKATSTKSQEQGTRKKHEKTKFLKVNRGLAKISIERTSKITTVLQRIDK